MKSTFFGMIFDLYTSMGDDISKQYGGSVAHKQLGKSKALAIGETLTGIKRHLANYVTDPGRQKVMNLFLGIYNPQNNSVPIWQMQDDQELH